MCPRVRSSESESGGGRTLTGRLRVGPRLSGAGARDNLTSNLNCARSEAESSLGSRHVGNMNNRDSLSSHTRSSNVSAAISASDSAVQVIVKLELRRSSAKSSCFEIVGPELSRT
eukprot:3662643-Rhodomonas_salina.1